MKRYYIIMLAVIVAMMAGCSSGEGGKLPKFEETEAIPVVTIKMETGGEVDIELYPNIARNTVNNFIHLVQEGFYDGLTFHRIVPGFMIQGGDPEGTGLGGPGYEIVGEFTDNGYKNDLSHERGVISMARTQDPDSAGSQFFIMVEDTAELDDEYAAFGKVIDGMDTVDDIAEAEHDSHAQPLEDQVIESITIELDGYEPEDPITIEP